MGFSSRKTQVNYQNGEKKHSSAIVTNLVNKVKASIINLAIRAKADIDFQAYFAYVLPD